MKIRNKTGRKRRRSEIAKIKYSYFCFFLVFSFSVKKKVNTERGSRIRVGKINL